MSRYPHIAHPYTHDEILAKIDSDDYGAEMLLQHLVLVADRYREALEKAAERLDEAADSISDWGCYASTYFQEKHGLQSSVDEYRAYAEEARAALREEEK